MSNGTGASIIYAAQDSQICYGTQQSFMQTTWSPFITVTDNDAPGNGPAYYFQQFFDKVVVLPETALPAPTGSNKQKRQGFQLDQGWLQQKSVAQPGDRPWFCVWNNTFLEGFIYVQQPIASSYVLPTASPTPTANTSASGSSATLTSGGKYGQPTEFLTTTVTMSTSTATFTGPAWKVSAWASHVSENEANPTQSGYDNDVDTGNNHSKRGEPKF